jgi:hypothetical protein
MIQSDSAALKYVLRVIEIFQNVQQLCAHRIPATHVTTLSARMDFCHLHQASGFQCVLPLQIPVWRQHSNGAVVMADDIVRA